MLTLASPEIFHIQAAAFDDAFQCANRNRFIAVHGHDDLATILVSPFLMAAGLSNAEKAMSPQNLDDFFGVADWIPPAHGTASSINLEDLRSLRGEGSNQSARASLAFEMASASVSVSM